MSESTREIIKKKALSLFAQKGYYGTTMNEIAELVGIKTPSLYFHFSGKEELFFSVYEDLANEYVSLMDRIMTTIESTDIEDRLFYIFEQYIIYYIDNPEKQYFWNQIIFFTPSELKEQFFSHISNCDTRSQKKMQEILAKEIERGQLRNSSPFKISWSFRSMRQGIIFWLMMAPELRRDELIKACWSDLWLGLKKR
ncbi:MAG: TetR/AcrR family transcriptional regulator [Desulfitobacteriaceae bacterium]|nr:TetR/AcrR family transcriptional regulator [Desulfitobacteriaceae bacterium]MDD4401210.1 TetR/AcrR family transcriptional regulator [Desulfitobacteriaceae bacterium]